MNQQQSTAESSGAARDLRPWRREAGLYLGALVACLLILCWIMRLWQADLRVPFVYSADTLLTAVAIRTTVDQGWYFSNPALGAPSGLQFYDYPGADVFHFFVIKILSFFTRNFWLILNLHFLAGFALTTLTSLYVMRRAKVSAACALLGSLLYAFLPFHFMRGEAHLFLSFYAWVPVATMLALWIIDGSLARPAPALIAHLKERKTGVLLATLFCLVLASSGLYYAFFACFFFFLAGLYSSFARHNRFPFIVACFFIGVILFGILLNVAPNLAYWSAQGKNPGAVVRNIGEVELYGLKISQLVLPMSGHRSDFLSGLKGDYNAAMPMVNENDTATLGLVGVIGFGILLLCLISKRVREFDARLSQLSVLNIGALLLATIGGFSAVFNLVVGPYIRCYNRISVYIAFFCLFAVVICLDKTLKNLPASSPLRRSFYLVPGILLLVGLLDQTTPGFAPDYSGVQKQFFNDQRFVRRVEAAAPPDGMIFQLPFVEFPESPPMVKMTDYQHLRPYLHSKTTRWSYGAIKGRPGSRQQKQLARRPTPELVGELKAAGFCGIYINRDGYEDKGYELESELGSLLGTYPVRSDDGSLLFFPFPKS